MLSPSARQALRSAWGFVWTSCDEIVHQCDLESYDPPRASFGGNIEIAEPENPLVELFRICPQFLSTAKRYLDSGFHVMLLRIDGKPMGYVWWHDNRVAHPHPTLERYGIGLQDDEAYLFNLFVLPQCRAGGTAGAFFAQFLRELRDRGVRRTYGFVDYVNLPARWMFSAHGWKSLFRFKGVVIGNSLLITSNHFFVNCNLLAMIDRKRRRIVREFVPIGLKIHRGQ